MTPGSRRGRYDSDSDSQSPPRSRRKSFGEQALAALGLGGAAAAISGKDKDRARSRSRRRGDYEPDRSRSHSDDRSKKIQQAVKSAAVAAAVEAFRSRKEPGGWQGQGKRVLTAAIGAAGINGAIDKDPHHHSTRHTLEAALGGLASNRLINGARSRSRSRGRNSSGREESNLGGAGGLAAASGLAALGVKAFNDYRNKSRDRNSDRGRHHSDDYSDGSRSPPPRKRSNSVSAFITRGLDKGKAALGIEPDRHDRDDRRDSGRGSHGGNDDRLSRQGGSNDYYTRPRGGGYEEDSQAREHDSSTDYSSEEEIKKQRKMHTKELITAGFATVATIHAGHTIYQTREKRLKRKQKVKEGTMSPEEAKKLEKKGYMQDAASVGIAGLGIQSAYSEWKETKETRDEYREACKELEAKRQRRREKQMVSQRGQGGGGGRNPSGGNRRSDPNLYQRYDGYGPRYADANPYGAGGLPPPPMGPPPLRY